MMELHEWNIGYLLVIPKASHNKTTLFIRKFSNNRLDNLFIGATCSTGVSLKSSIRNKEFQQKEIFPYAHTVMVIEVTVD